MANSRNVMSNMKAYADLKRNAFDLQNGHYYSQKVGEIIPIKAVHTLPGDYMQVDINDRNLSFPMNTAAFVHARKEITSYHVPYNHLYSLFNQLQATRPDPKTSALVTADQVEEPRMALMDLYYNVFAQYYFWWCYNKYIPWFVNDYLSREQYSYDDEAKIYWIGVAQKQFLNNTIMPDYYTNFSAPQVVINPGLGEVGITFPDFEFRMAILHQPKLFLTKIGDESGDDVSLSEYCLDIAGHRRISSRL